MCGVSLLLLAVSALALKLSGRNDLVWGVVSGFLVSLLNIASAFFSLKWAFAKSHTTFFVVVFGGMGFRIVVIIVSLFVVAKMTQIPLGAFVASLIGFYLVLQVMEIRFIQKNLVGRKAAA